MDMDKFKRDYRYKSSEGNSNNWLKWLIIGCAVIIALIAFLRD